MILSKKPPEPKNGERKVEKCFAWFPTWVNDQQIWLQHFERVFEYRVKERNTTFFIRGYASYPYKGTWGEWELVKENIL